MGWRGSKKGTTPIDAAGGHTQRRGQLGSAQGAHLLQVRTRVLNDDLPTVFQARTQPLSLLQPTHSDMTRAA